MRASTEAKTTICSYCGTWITFKTIEAKKLALASKEGPIHIVCKKAKKQSLVAVVS